MKLKVDNFASALAGIETDRKLSKKVVEDALIEALTKAYRKHIEIPDAYVRVEITNGVIHIYHERMVVEDVQDDELEISWADAKKLKAGVQLGDMISEEVDFRNFDRAAVVLAKNVMKQKIREAEKLQVYEEYCDKVDDMVNGTVETVEEKFVIVNIGKTLAMMKKAAQIPSEKYFEGEHLPVIITEVNKDTKGAQVLVSRSTPVFVKRLFEKEVPEIYNGIIEIKAIARDPGERCKIAVYSKNENIDPIGACIGPRGTRVQAIINELNGEKIDIFEWSDDIQKLITNALSPSEGLAVIPNEDVKDGLIVVVPDSQLSLAIGKRGKNARLAVKLSGHKIDIKSQSEMDAAGIDYMGLAKKMHDEYLERKEKERAYKQQQIKETLAAQPQEMEDVTVADFDYEEPELPELPPVPADTLYEKEQEKSVQPEELPAPVSQPEQPKELSDMEEAARIAREKRKEKHLTDVTEYTSKFETMAGTGKPEAAAPKKKEEHKEPAKPEKKEKKKPVFGAMKPIYSDEELAEIEEQEEYNDYDAWDEDIDYEDFDSYYDD